jgi:cell wall-associated NlpC family hydrolase
MTTRADIVRVARSYVGTPFLHRGRKPGLSLDCAGVVICAMRETGLVAPDFDVPEYARRPDGTTLMSLCSANLTRIAQREMQPGDVIVLITDADPQHLGILADYRHGGLSMIHASNDVRYLRTLEMRLMFSRHQRFAAAFSIPGVE